MPRGVWHAGNAAFMRNWPYAYSSSLESEAVAENFGVAPVPAGDAGVGAATLGGWHIGVSRYSENPGSGGRLRRLYDECREPEALLNRHVVSPAVLALYSDPDIQAAMPFSSPEVVEVTTARPSTATAEKYNEVSTLYFEAVHSVLTGEQDAASAMELLELDLMDLLSE